MSHIACAEYGINTKMFNKVCPGPYKDNPLGFARIYIGGLQSYASQLESQVKSKDNIIQLLTPRDGTISI
jgi:hypothetical protein